MKIILLDLCGTLIKEENSNYNKALQWLADTYFDGRFEELKYLSILFKDKYIKQRNISNIESNFIEQLVFFENHLRIKLKDDYKSIEFNFMLIFRKEKLIDGVVSLLQFLQSHHYKIFIITNSLFSGANIKKYLSIFNISCYIDKVYSSADIGYRKPGFEIFSYVLEDLNIDCPYGIYFIGDSFEKDYIAGLNFGFKSILLASDNNIKGLVFCDMHKVLTYFQNLHCNL